MRGNHAEEVLLAPSKGIAAFADLPIGRGQHRSTQKEKTALRSASIALLVASLAGPYQLRLPHSLVVSVGIAEVIVRHKGGVDRKKYLIDLGKQENARSK